MLVVCTAPNAMSCVCAGDLGLTPPAPCFAQRRLKLELDTPGKGRKPWLVNPTLVLLLTRGGPSMSLVHGIRNALDLPVSRTPGSGLFSTPFRWDTKMFTIVLPGPDDVAAAASAAGAGRRRGAGDRAGAGAGNGADAPKRPAQAHLSELSQATGGRLYRTTDVRGTRSVALPLLHRHPRFMP